MVEALATLGRTMGFSLAAGVNLYATVAILGVAQRFGWVTLPDQFKVFDHDWVIAAAGLLYVVEFVADKVPWVDSIWDSIHTLIRPVGGALIAVASLGDANPVLTGMTALLGGTIAASSHASKAATRVAANASPEPFSNWFLSFAEDIFVISLSFLTLKYPVMALVISILILTSLVVAVRLIWKWFKRRDPVVVVK